MDFSKTVFSTFLFWYFLFLEAVVKTALFVVGEVGAIQVVINPSPVYLPTTSDLSAKVVGKVHACLSEQVRKADFVPFLFRLCLL